MKHPCRTNIRKIMITLLVLIFLVLCLLYTTDFQTSFRLARGKEAAHIVVPLNDPQWSLVYPIFWVGERDTQTILVTPGVPERLGSQAPLFVVDLQAAKFERFTPETVQFEIAQRLQPYIDRTASAKESNVLLRSADNRRASLSFSGLHLKLPVYRLAGFPEAARKGWEFVDSYSGTLRLEINSPEGNGIDFILQQRPDFSARRCKRALARVSARHPMKAHIIQALRNAHWTNDVSR